MTHDHVPDHSPAAGVAPVWPNGPRYAPTVPLPAVAFLPGEPRNERADIAVLVRNHSAGTRDDFLRFGVDLYHNGFHWEAHEAWEALWSRLPRKDIEAKFYRGLILNAAAQLKRREGRMRGVATLSRGSYAALLEVLPHGEVGVFLKMDLARVLQEMQCHYGALWEQQAGGSLRAVPPRLELIV